MPINQSFKTEVLSGLNFNLGRSMVSLFLSEHGINNLRKPNCALAVINQCLSRQTKGSVMKLYKLSG